MLNEQEALSTLSNLIPYLLLVIVFSLFLVNRWSSIREIWSRLKEI